MKTTKRVPIRERQRRIGEGLRFAHKRKRTTQERLLLLCRELDMELDGVNMPATAAAIMNAIRSLVTE